MAAPKRNSVERERDLERLARLYVRGRTQAEIAQQLSISRQQVGYDLRVLKQRWQVSQDRCIGEELAKIDTIEREHWKAWEKTQDVRHLSGALACVERRCRLLGFDNPENVRLTGRTFGQALELLRRASGNTAVAAVLQEPAPSVRTSGEPAIAPRRAGERSA